MSASNECPVSLLVLISLLLFVWPSVAMRFPSQSFRHHTYAYHHSHAQQTTSQSSQLQDVFSWKALDFAFPSEFTRNEAVNLGSFIPGAPVPIDADVYYGIKKTLYIFGFYTRQHIQRNIQKIWLLTKN